MNSVVSGLRNFHVRMCDSVLILDLVLPASLCTHGAVTAASWITSEGRVLWCFNGPATVWLYNRSHVAQAQLPGGGGVDRFFHLSDFLILVNLWYHAKVRAKSESGNNFITKTTWGTEGDGHHYSKASIVLSDSSTSERPELKLIHYALLATAGLSVQGGPLGRVVSSLQCIMKCLCR